MSRCDVTVWCHMSWWWRSSHVHLVVSPQDLVKMKRFSFLSCRWGKLLPYTCSQFGFYLSLYVQTLRMHLSFWYRPPACTLELEKCCLKKPFLYRHFGEYLYTNLHILSETPRRTRRIRSNERKSNIWRSISESELKVLCSGDKRNSVSNVMFTFNLLLIIFTVREDKLSSLTLL